MSDRVTAQYEAYPYPNRRPQDDKTRLIEGSPSHLKEVDHYVFGGRLIAGDRRAQGPLKVLAAGGGTGDGLIMLAQHLADVNFPAEIHYIDLSSASRRIAEARAEVRRLTNIRFHTGSLLDLSRLGLGPFDYIDCCGVLHHLESPAAGLAALQSVLAPGGGIGLMLYGTLGRTGVYHAQAMLRMIAGDAPTSERLALAKRLLADLPGTNWLRRNPAIVDYRQGGEAELYDLLLHSRDRAFTVPEIAEMAAGAGLDVVAFIDPWRYDPESYISDPKLRARLAGLSPLERASLAELLAGNIKTHICYLVAAGRGAVAMAAPTDPAAIPVMRNDDGAGFARSIKEDRVSFRMDGLEMAFPVPRMAGPILSRIDGRRNLSELQSELAAEFGPRAAPSAFAADFDRLYKVMNGIGRLLIRRTS
jgi:2-polyprenyl-3-methyl-5-hydroxy-6-metoxy-1,4-benzoquinol methylase